jgi:fission process protein 1
VRSAYGISWSYLIGDVGHEGYKAYLRNWKALAPTGDAYKDASEPSQDQIIKGMATGNMTIGNQAPKDAPNWTTPEIPLAEDYRMVMVKRAVFQSIASMGLPAFTIHSVVRYSGQMVKGVKNTFIRTWTPIGVCIPQEHLNIQC